VIVMPSTQPRGRSDEIGDLLRGWRERRRFSQLELASRAGVSSRHLSFIETGRSTPTSAMIERLAEHLDVPLRERNRLLLSAGYAPAYTDNDLDAPEMAAVHSAIQQVLRGHEPYPSVAVDRTWNLLHANTGIALFTEGAAADLLEPPVNALRLSLHPEGMAPRIVNLAEWRARILGRLRREISATADPDLADLYTELKSYSSDATVVELDPCERAGVVVPLRYRIGDTELSFVSTTTVFGTPTDITVAELAIESFLPADAETAVALHAGLCAGGGE
jgi:transcriptional regulator with XRE-family HTH domain